MGKVNKFSIRKCKRLFKFYKGLRWLRRHLGITFLILLAIVLLLWGLFWFLYPKFSCGDLGDSFGTLNTLFSGFAFVGVIIAILLQSQELKEQRKELALTRKEFAIQNNTAKLQRFENSFYNMLSQFQEIVKNLSLPEGVTIISPSNSTPVTGVRLFEVLYKGELDDGVKEFYPLQELLRLKSLPPDFKIEESESRYKLDEHIHTITRIWNEHPALSALSHYFRFLYRILKLVNETEAFNDFPDAGLEKKLNYAGIVRGFLSEYEIIMIFYNDINPEFYKMKDMIEKYHLFKNWNSGLVAGTHDFYLYKKSAFSKKIQPDCFDESGWY